MQINSLIILHHVACEVPHGHACVSSRLGVGERRGDGRCAAQTTHCCQHTHPEVTSSEIA